MGKGKLWPSANPKPLKRLSPNLNGVITSWMPTTKKKLGLNLPRGFCSPYEWNIHPSCSKFTTLFWFLNSPTGESVRLIFMLNMSNDVVLCKEVPFYCYKIKILFFTYLFEKFEKIQWRLWQKLKKFLNCHNFGCVQDRVVIFGFRIRFTGTEKLTVTFIFTPDWPSNMTNNIKWRRL